MPTIAVVDDDRNILTSISIALEAEGYRVMTYSDGASALDGFNTSPPDLAILDTKMPRMDGTLREDSPSNNFRAPPKYAKYAPPSMLSTSRNSSAQCSRQTRHILLDHHLVTTS